MRFRSHPILTCFDEERRCRGALWRGGMAWCWESGRGREAGGRRSTYGRLPGTDAALGFWGQTLGSDERNGAWGTDTFVWMDTRMDMKGRFLDVPGDRSQGVLRVGIS